MKYVLFFGALLATFWMHTSSSKAHVLITDQTNTIGGVLHINPDDDPIAGEPAILFLDPQISEEVIDSMQLTIRDADGTEIVVDDSFTYIFPTQGVYELVFAVNSSGYNYIFTHTQLVSRGVSSSVLDKPSFIWAEVLVLSSAIGFILLAMFVLNYRKEIRAQSTF